jgi:hypothetical protein
LRKSFINFEVYSHPSVHSGKIKPIPHNHFLLSTSIFPLQISLYLVICIRFLKIIFPMFQFLLLLRGGWGIIKMVKIVKMV